MLLGKVGRGVGHPLEQLILNVATMEPALRYEAIQQGNIQITDSYSTDPEIAQYDLAAGFPSTPTW